MKYYQIIILSDQHRNSRRNTYETVDSKFVQEKHIEAPTQTKELVLLPTIIERNETTRREVT